MKGLQDHLQIRNRNDSKTLTKQLLSSTVNATYFSPVIQNSVIVDCEEILQQAIVE